MKSFSLILALLPLSGAFAFSGINLNIRQPAALALYAKKTKGKAVNTKGFGKVIEPPKSNAPTFPYSRRHCEARNKAAAEHRMKALHCHL